MPAQLKLIMQSPHERKIWSITEFPALFGRDRMCNYCIDDSSISRQHFLIECTPAGFVLEDLCSTRGVHLNGQRLEGSCTLRHQDRFQAGDLIFEVLITEAEEELSEEENEASTYVVRRQIQMQQISFWKEQNESSTVYRSHQALKSLYEIVRQCASHQETGNLLTGLLEALFKIVTAHRGAVVLKEHNRYECKALLTQHGDSSFFRISQTILTDVIENGVCVISDDLPHDSRYTEVSSLFNSNVATLICVPLLSEAKVFGALYLDRFISENTPPFSYQDLEFVAMVGIQLGSSLERILLLDKHTALLKEKEVTLQRLQHTQSEMIRQERLRALGQMASGIVHDLNNYLLPIVGFSDLLIKADWLTDTARVREYLQMIYQAAQEASKVVTGLRDFYRRRGNDKFAQVDLNKMVQHCVELTQPKWKTQAQSKGATIKICTQLTAIPPICGQANELQQAVIHLIFNAIDAIEKHGEIVLSTGLTEQAKDTQIFIKVTDTGCGMTEEVRQHCLEPFFCSSHSQGSGMGLAFVFGVVQRHKGHIQIESTPGEGTAVTLYLPLQPTPDQSASSDGDPPPLHILVLEKNPVVRDVIMEYLKLDQHVSKAPNGQEELDKLCWENFDVVIMERGIKSALTGDLLSRLRHDYPHLIIIELLEFCEVRKPVLHQSPRSDFIMQKPILLKELRQVLQQCRRKKTCK